MVQDIAQTIVHIKQEGLTGSNTTKIVNSDFNMNDDYGKMVLNPDVAVRSRGVMEKCSFCIQSTQQTILDAKKEGREIKDGEFNNATACSAACSSGAIVFGDINDANDDSWFKRR